MLKLHPELDVQSILFWVYIDNIYIGYVEIVDNKYKVCATHMLSRSIYFDTMGELKFILNLLKI